MSTITPTIPSTITICIGAHGSTTAVRTRSDDDIRYPPDFNLNFLSIAGRANRQTQVGLVFERKNKKEQKKLISGIKKHDTYKLFKDDVPIRLEGLGTDYLTLSYLVPNIFVRDRTINDQLGSIKVMEEMETEMHALAMLADIKYPKSSPPEIFKNEQIKKMWWFDDNPGDNLRGLDRKGRSAPSRAAGKTEYNPILAINGLFILHTTKPNHSPFSISNITGLHEFHDVNGVSLITYEAIRRRNLLRKINYTSYWKKFIDAYNFSEVPDEDVLEIGSIREAVFIVKQIYFAFQSENATDDSTDDRLGGADFQEDQIVNDREMEERPVAEYLGPPSPPPSHLILEQLKTIILPKLDEAIDLYKLSKNATDTVQSLRAPFLKGAEAADGIEKQIEELRLERLLRSVAREIDRLTQELARADSVLDEQRIQLTQAKAKSEELESQLVTLQGEIVAGVTDIIRNLILNPEYNPENNTDVKAAIKNIIMRNKLKNILKFGIYHKRLSLRQLVLFFRSLGYNIINIVDPSCFVVKPPRQGLMTDIDTQELHNDSQPDIDLPNVGPRDNLDKPLLGIKHLIQGEQQSDHKRSSGSGRGGTKRKKSKCLRKRRTRKKMRTTQRRRQKRRNF
jgi:hypothetical protein